MNMSGPCVTGLQPARLCVQRHRHFARLSANRFRHPTRSSADKTYDLEDRLRDAGFTQSQARSLLVTGSRMTQLQEKADFRNISRVFEVAWQIEDDMMQQGMVLEQARRISCMFVALAATQVDRESELFWRVWEASETRNVTDSLKAAGAPHTTYTLADTMLDYWTAQVLEQRKTNHTAVSIKRAWSSLRKFLLESVMNLLAATWYIFLMLFMFTITVILPVKLGMISVK